jgi:hypothetical protein
VPREPLSLAPAASQAIRGEPVDPNGYYFRTALTIEAGPGDYEWFNRARFVAVAARAPSSVVYDLHEVL